MKFEELLGRTVAFYGVDANCFKIAVDGKIYIFEAVEDEQDGYRSCLGCFELVDGTQENLVFYEAPMAFVVIDEETEGMIYGYTFVDVETGHKWLQIGTDESDSYYPAFVFDYVPDKSKKIPW